MLLIYLWKKYLKFKQLTFWDSGLEWCISSLPLTSSNVFSNNFKVSQVRTDWSSYYVTIRFFHRLLWASRKYWTKRVISSFSFPSFHQSLRETAWLVLISFPICHWICQHTHKNILTDYSFHKWLFWWLWFWTGIASEIFLWWSPRALLCCSPLTELEM